MHVVVFFSGEMYGLFVLPLKCDICLLKSEVTPPHLHYSSELGRGNSIAYAKGNIYNLCKYVTEGLERFGN